MISLENNKLRLQYPTIWRYKIIIFSGQKIDNVVNWILNNRDYKLTKSNDSKNGKYESLSLETLVFSDEDRIFIFDELKKSKLVKMIL